MGTAWFSEMSDGGADAATDGGVDDDDAAIDAGPVVKDGGVVDAPAHDAGVDAAVVETGTGTGTGPADTSPTTAESGAGDEPGETNSLGDSTSSKNRPSVSDEEPQANAGCSVGAPGMRRRRR